MTEHEINALPPFLAKQRWFAAKSRMIAGVHIADSATLNDGAFLVLLDVRYADGGSDTYFLPLARKPRIYNANVPQTLVTETLCDGVFDDQLCTKLLELMEKGGQIPTQFGAIVGHPSRVLPSLLQHGSTPLTVRLSPAEQSNSSIIYGDRLIMKLYRRPEAGRNPDCEINAYLTEQSSFTAIPPFGGSIEYHVPGREPATIAMLQGLVQNRGDGWKWTLEDLHRYYHEAGDFGDYMNASALLGRRTAEMHAALAAATDPEFKPEPLSTTDLQSVARQMQDHAHYAFEQLKASGNTSPEAATVLRRRDRFDALFESLPAAGIQTEKIRIHGDYHLGQVLRVKNDFVILDFEGEPARPLAERRAKHSPLKDVAGMLRSFSYASQVSLFAFRQERGAADNELEMLSRSWEQKVCTAFLDAYVKTAGVANWLPAESSAFHALLGAYLLDKVLYEMSYEIENRPQWIHIPIAGILSLEHRE